MVMLHSGFGCNDHGWVLNFETYQFMIMIGRICYADSISYRLITVSSLYQVCLIDP